MGETSRVGGFEGAGWVSKEGEARDECCRAREKRTRAALVDPRREWERAMARHL